MQHGEMIITDIGLALQAKIQAGFQKLKFTRVAIGSGGVENPEDVTRMTALAEYKQTVSLNDIRVKNSTAVILEAVISNQTVEEGYFIKEIGVFAEDDDRGEILYAIVNFGNRGDYMPSKTERDLEVVLNLHIAVSNAERVEVTVDYSLVFVTKKEFYDLAGKGRTTETVKKNADDILALTVKVSALEGAALNNINSNIFVINMKKLTTEEIFEGYWNTDIGRLEV